MDVVKDPETTKKKIVSFFDKDSAKYEGDRWSLEKPESFYDFNVTRNALEQALHYTDIHHPVVLDIGSGTGVWARQLALLTEPGQIVCLDLSEKMLERSRDSVDNQYGDMIWVLADAEQPLPFEDQVFDIVLCSHTLEYLPNYASLPRELERVLKEHAIFLLITKNKRAMIWRMVKAIADAVATNPLVYQRWFEPNELLTLFGTLRARDLRGISLRPPTCLDDLNDGLKLRTPRWFSRMICGFLYPIETRFNELNSFTQYLFWHLCIIFQKPS